MPYQFACISASNVENARQASASTRTCELIGEILKTIPGQQDAHVDLIPLLDYELTPCRMCGSCYVDGFCQHDPAFNQIFARLSAANAIFLVCPHYAPFPSKLMMLLEKMEEIAYLNYCANPEYRFALHGKPVGLVAHGGQGEEAMPYYRKALLEPLANAFGSLQARVISAGAEQPLGVAFGIRSLSGQTDTIFVKIEHDWDLIRARLTPLVQAVAAEVLREKEG